MLNTSRLTLLILALITAAPAFADINDCLSDDVQCSYVAGLPTKDLKDGRVLRVDIQQYGPVYICMNYTGAADLSSQDAAGLVGQTLTETFYACRDTSGADCTLIGTNTYTISKTNNNYIATPKFFKIDMQAAVTMYPSCDATQVSPHAKFFKR